MIPGHAPDDEDASQLNLDQKHICRPELDAAAHHRTENGIPNQVWDDKKRWKWGAGDEDMYEHYLGLEPNPLSYPLSRSRRAF